MNYSQNGYPVLDTLEDCRRYRVGDASIPLAPGNAGYLLANFGRRFNRAIEKLNRTDTHGYSKRKISGSKDWSNHASGTAVDLNATQHPYGAIGTFSEREEEIIFEILDDFDDTIRWGGSYRTTKDEMHFEIDKGREEVNIVAKRLRRHGKVYLSRLQPGKRNLDVYMVKRELQRRGFYPDDTLGNYFGKKFQSAYADWQASLGYEGVDADGVPGPTSLEALGFTVIS